MLLLAGLIGDVVSPYKGTGYPDTAAGLIVFLSNIIKLITAVGGLMLFLNLVLAGLKYILSGSDPKALQEAGSSITNSILGLIIIAASFIVISIISLVFFGRADFILNPTISGPGISSCQVTIPGPATWDDCKKAGGTNWIQNTCCK